MCARYARHEVHKLKEPCPRRIVNVASTYVIKKLLREKSTVTPPSMDLTYVNDVNDPYLGDFHISSNIPDHEQHVKDMACVECGLSNSPGYDGIVGPDLS